MSGRTLLTCSTASHNLPMRSTCSIALIRGQLDSLSLSICVFDGLHSVQTMFARWLFWERCLSSHCNRSHCLCLSVSLTIAERPHAHQQSLFLYVQSSKEMTCSALMTGTRELYTLTPEDSATL